MIVVIGRLLTTAVSFTEGGETRWRKDLRLKAPERLVAASTNQGGRNRKPSWFDYGGGGGVEKVVR